MRIAGEGPPGSFPLAFALALCIPGATAATAVGGAICLEEPALRREVLGGLLEGVELPPQLALLLRWHCFVRSNYCGVEELGWNGGKPWEVSLAKGLNSSLQTLFGTLSELGKPIQLLEGGGRGVVVGFHKGTVRLRIGEDGRTVDLKQVPPARLAYLSRRHIPRESQSTLAIALLEALAGNNGAAKRRLKDAWEPAAEELRSLVFFLEPVSSEWQTVRFLETDLTESDRQWVETFPQTWQRVHGSAYEPYLRDALRRRYVRCYPLDSLLQPELKGEVRQIEAPPESSATHWISIRYDFSTAEQLQDFVVDECPETLRQSLRLVDPEWQGRAFASWTVHGGALAGPAFAEASMALHAVPFAGELEIELQAQLPPASDDALAAPQHLAVGVQSGRLDHAVVAADHRQLLAAQSGSPRSALIGVEEACAPTHSTLRALGDRVQLRTEHGSPAELLLRSPIRGQVVLLGKGRPSWRVTGLELRGVVDPDHVAKLRKRVAEAAAGRVFRPPK
jgi:hypothetical protein